MLFEMTTVIYHRDFFRDFFLFYLQQILKLFTLKTRKSGDWSKSV